MDTETTQSVGYSFDGDARRTPDSLGALRTTATLETLLTREESRLGGRFGG